MTETTTTTATDGGENETADRRSPKETGILPTFRTEAAINYLLWAAFVASGLFALVAAAGLYANVTNAIGIWVTREFRPLVMAGFNLVVLIAALLVAAAVLRSRD